MLNLFQSPELKEEVPGYDIHLDQLADKEYEDFIKCIDYMNEGPSRITHTPNKEGYYQQPV